MRVLVDEGEIKPNDIVLLVIFRPQGGDMINLIVKPSEKMEREEMIMRLEWAAKMLKDNNYLKRVK